MLIVHEVPGLVKYMMTDEKGTLNKTQQSKV